MKQSFVNLEYPLVHPGVERAEKAVANIQQMSGAFNPTRTLAGVLLAAIITAFVVVADQMMDTWAEGHLLAAWVALWAVIFASLGLFASFSKSLAIKTKEALDNWAASMAQSRADARMWAIAQKDARLMSELQCAMLRSDEEALLGENTTQKRVTRLLRTRQYFM
jgi:hypothetical protein